MKITLPASECVACKPEPPFHTRELFLTVLLHGKDRIGLWHRGEGNRCSRIGFCNKETFSPRGDPPPTQPVFREGPLGAAQGPAQLASQTQDRACNGWRGMRGLLPAGVEGAGRRAAGCVVGISWYSCFGSTESCSQLLSESEPALPTISGSSSCHHP